MDKLDILTERQRKILDYLVDYHRKHNKFPSYREMGKQFDIKSTNGVSCHLMALCRKGFISFLQSPIKKITFTLLTKAEYSLPHNLSQRLCINCKYGVVKNTDPPCVTCRRLPARLRPDNWSPRSDAIAKKIKEPTDD